MKNQIKNIAFILFVIINMVACKKENDIVKPQMPAVSTDYVISVFFDTISMYDSMKFRISGVNQSTNASFDTTVNVNAGEVKKISLNKMRLNNMRVNINNQFNLPISMSVNLKFKNTFTAKDIDKYLSVSLDDSKVEPLYNEIIVKGTNYTEFGPIKFQNILKN